jgi:hypothetical protein
MMAETRPLAMVLPLSLRSPATSSPATLMTSACWRREIDTANGEQLGNFPQAFGHIGLITAAPEIDRAKGLSE